MESNEIIEQIQENKNYYSLEDKKFGIIGILIELYIKNISFEIHEIFILFKKMRLGIGLNPQTNIIKNN